MQVAAMRPVALDESSVSEETKKSELDVYKRQEPYHPCGYPLSEPSGKERRGHDSHLRWPKASV